MPHEYHDAVLVLPRLRVQNANAISSPMTWGFPAITAFIGMMHALARRLPPESGLEFRGVGVICHDFETQVTEGGYTRAFRLTRNPVDKDGSTLGIVEEGRIHIEVTLVFLVNLAAPHWTDAARQQLADKVSNLLATMRIAGGSVLPSAPGSPRPGRVTRPQLRLLPDRDEDRRVDFRRMKYRWLPGFALVARDDLLSAHLAKLQRADGRMTVLDAWLDLSRRNHHSTRTSETDEQTGVASEHIAWVTERPDGWIVPIPVGYAGLSELYDGGTVGGARDESTPFRFVESVYSVGQWVSPHRLADLDDLLWYAQYDELNSLYRCRNDFVVPPTSTATSARVD